MPELPEVETVKRELQWLVGRKITKAARGPDAPAGPKYARIEEAAGKTITSVARRGKFILVGLDSGDVLVVHLGMTGTLAATPPPDHLRIVLTLAGRPRKSLYFRDPRRFGRFLFAPAGRATGLPTLDALGPEPLEPDFTSAALAAGLARSRMPVKAALLGQRVVAGVGNIYADEALFRAKIHPETPACDVPAKKIAPLHAAIVEVLQASIDNGGTTLRDYRRTDGERGEFLGRLLVYGKDGLPCPRCQKTLVRTIVAQRGTTYCPGCQRFRSRAP